jgi:CheY-like chemotaxis protein
MAQKGGVVVAKVLLIEDDAAQRELYRSLLYYNGFDVLTAADGLTGLDMATREQPDAVVLDVMMPGMNGLVTAQRLHTQPSTAHIPVICMSAYDVSAQLAKQSGAAELLLKPVAGDVLVRAIRRYIGWDDQHPPVSGPAG